MNETTNLKRGPIQHFACRTCKDDISYDPNDISNFINLNPGGSNRIPKIKNPDKLIQTAIYLTCINDHVHKYKADIIY